MAIAAFVVRGGVVRIGAIVRVRVAFLPAAVLMMRKRHALGACNCGHALDRNGQGQHQHSKDADEGLRHQRGL